MAILNEYFTIFGLSRPRAGIGYDFGDIGVGRPLFIPEACSLPSLKLNAVRTLYHRKPGRFGPQDPPISKHVPCEIFTNYSSHQTCFDIHAQSTSPLCVLLTIEYVSSVIYLVIMKVSPLNIHDLGLVSNQRNWRGGNS